VVEESGVSKSSRHGAKRRGGLDCPYLFCSAERAGAEVEYLMTVDG